MSGEKHIATHIAIVCGGLSGEREVSLASGAAVEAALKQSSMRTTLIDADTSLAAQLLELKPDIIFNALHGQWGESGVVQGLFESLAIPYTHSGVLASALAMNKEQSKIIFAAAGLPLAEHLIAERAEIAREHLLPPPYVIKPLAEGSSLGVFIVKEGANAPPSILSSADWQYGERLMVERYIEGRELSCAVLNDKALGIAEVMPTGDRFYDYSQKYDSDGALHEVPAKVNKDLTERIKEISLTAHKILGCRGASRCDFRYNEKTNQLALLELNTQPGMMRASLVPEIARAAGMEMKILVRSLIEDASCNK